ncbi:MAG: phosphatidate cytidylyltransferase [Acholeplasmatales bacterium]|nr:phosphatidate cytidylyltransferase [Acholeplasmatales bacterium]
MKTRIITGFCMGLVGIPLLIFAPVEVFIGLSVLLSLVGAYEIIHMFEVKNEARFSFLGKVCIFTLTAYENLTIALSFYFHKKDADFPMASILAISLFVMMLVIGLLIIFDKSIDSNNGSKLLLVANYVGIGFAAVPVLMLYGRGVLVYIIVVAAFTDMFAYFFGVALGTKFIKKRPAPVISPKKSFEGCIAGTIFGTVFGSLVFIFYNELFADGGTLFVKVCKIDSKALEITLIIILTLFVSFIGQVGDLVASKFKRDNGIKDYGKIFPGHGGVMDRFDSSLFISIFLVIIFIFLGVILPL